MPSLIKGSLQLNALEIYSIVVQRQRFIRAGTLGTSAWECRRTISEMVYCDEAGMKSWR